ncbi:MULTISPECIES: hypothetical protein [Achromobacter]|uniref:hypothetical protein n=1 Tax=Achromobacter TaxID=222 RepID=UPI0023F6276B|nr:hypothetical protein [Achromobacter anxifer]MDF8363350.1 hypothetical protein [Achromobacter anxifer]
MPAANQAYIDLDEKIEALVSAHRATRDGALTFTSLSSALSEHANTLVPANRHGEEQGWRLIDRRLQALRKAGRLAYSRKSGWTKPQPAAEQR